MKIHFTLLVLVFIVRWVMPLVTFGFCHDSLNFADFSEIHLAKTLLLQISGIP